MRRYWNSSCCAQIPLSVAGKDRLLTKGQVWVTGHRDLFSPIHQMFPCAPFQNIDVPSLGSFIFSKEHKSQMQGAASVMFPGLSTVPLLTQRGLQIGLWPPQCKQEKTSIYLRCRLGRAFWWQVLWALSETSWKGSQRTVSCQWNNWDPANPQTSGWHWCMDFPGFALRIQA